MRVHATIIADGNEADRIMLDIIRRFKGEQVPVRLLFYNNNENIPVVYDNAQWIKSCKELKEAENENNRPEDVQIQTAGLAEA